MSAQEPWALREELISSEQAQVESNAAVFQGIVLQEAVKADSLRPVDNILNHFNDIPTTSPIASAADDWSDVSSKTWDGTASLSSIGDAASDTSFESSGSSKESLTAVEKVYEEMLLSSVDLANPNHYKESPRQLLQKKGIPDRIRKDIHSNGARRSRRLSLSSSFDRVASTTTRILFAVLRLGVWLVIRNRWLLYTCYTISWVVANIRGMQKLATVEYEGFWFNVLAFTFAPTVFLLVFEVGQVYLHQCIQTVAKAFYNSSLWFSDLHHRSAQLLGSILIDGMLPFICPT